ncbi:MAG: ATP-binding cassette domain-containing protein [Bdellovibrionota bacterium]
MNRQKSAVEISRLQFGFENTLVFRDLTLNIPEFSRCLLLGANGIGKSTLLRVLAGKHLVRADSVKIFGEDPFSGNLGVHDVTLVAERFPFNLDVSVEELLQRQRASQEVKTELLELLQIDLAWRMHRVSNGQRRRVDLLLSFLNSPRLVLLDEVTSDLDILSRQRLLRWLKSKAIKRQMTTVFATHILDGMEDWATHLAFLSPVGLSGEGATLRTMGVLKRNKDFIEAKKKHPKAPLLWLCEKWLKEDERAAVKKN